MTTAGLLAQRYRLALRQNVDQYLRWSPFWCGLFFLWHTETAIDGVTAVPESQRYSINRWINGMDQERAVNVLFTGQDAATLALWERNQTVLDIDADLFRELGDVPPDQEIPPGLFHYLPYPDPFLAFPEPLILPIGGSDQYQEVQGAYLTGRRNGRLAEVDSGALCSTHEPGITEWAVTLGGRVHNPDGSIFRSPEGWDDYVLTRITLTDGGTLRSMAHASMTGFVALGDAGPELPESVERMFGAVLSSLIYVCTANADLQALPAGRPRKAGKSGRRAKAVPGAGVRMVKVGYRIGAALKAYRRAKAAGRPMPSGLKMPPHVRRSHFQKFAVGPGRPNERTGRRLRWVGPIEVNMEEFKGDTATVHRVPVKKGERVS